MGVTGPKLEISDGKTGLKFPISDGKTGPKFPISDGKTGPKFPISDGKTGLKLEISDGKTGDSFGASDTAGVSFGESFETGLPSEIRSIFGVEVCINVDQFCCHNTGADALILFGWHRQIFVSFAQI
ncbi:MAG: hypothetical protein ACYCOU_05920 [Sulfobacillus sp.]